MGVGDDLVTIPFSFLQQSLSRTTGLRHDLVGVLGGPVDIGFGVLFGDVHIIEGLDDLLRRVGLVDLNTHDLDACAIIVQQGLDLIGHFGLNDVAFSRDDTLKARFADNFAHHGLCHHFDSDIGLFHIQDVILWCFGLHAPEDGELNVDDIFVFSQHQALVHGLADLSLSAGFDLDQFMLLEGGRQVEVEAGAKIGLPFAEAEDGGLLARIYHNDAGGQPGKQGDTCDDQKAERTEIGSAAAATAATFATTAAAALPETFLHAPHLVFEVIAPIAARAAGTVPRRAAILAASIVISALAAPRAAGFSFVIPGHEPSLYYCAWVLYRRFGDKCMPVCRHQEQRSRRFCSDLGINHAGNSKKRSSKPSVGPIGSNRFRWVMV